MQSFKHINVIISNEYYLILTPILDHDTCILQAPFHVYIVQMLRMLRYAPPPDVLDTNTRGMNLLFPPLSKCQIN